jgi:hypothetical protein
MIMSVGEDAGRLIVFLRTGIARNSVTGQTTVAIEFMSDDGAVTRFVLPLDWAETLHQDLRQMIKLAREAQQ